MKNNTNTEKKIPVQFVTHNGKFHADEVMGTSILMIWYNLFLKDSFEVKVIRTDNPSPYVDDHISIIYDIGGGCFDHHQKEVRVRENGVPYASAGLLWAEYCRGAVYGVIKDVVDGLDNDERSNLITAVCNYVDKFLIQGIDAADNGKAAPAIVPIMDDKNQETGNLVSLTTISDIISNMNQGWCFEEIPADARFSEAVDLCTSVLVNEIQRATSVLLAQKTVNDAIHSRKYKRILVLDKYMPWISTMLANEEAVDIWYCIFPSARKKGHWQMQAVPSDPVTKEQRHPVPTEWWAATGETMPGITGVAEAEFCHKFGFLSGATTLEGMLKLAQLACAAGDPYKEELELYVPASSNTSEYKEV